MRPLDIKRDVRTFLASNWTRFPIRKLNKVDADGKPVDLNGNPIDVTETHGVLNFNPGESSSLEIRGASNRPGVFIIQVFTPLKVGTDEGWGHSGRLEELFLNESLGDIAFQSGELVPYSTLIGKDDDLQMFQHNVIIPFSVITN